eukprot:scaffold2748_cov193-Alexandrium_tamarense.AAC.13
MFQVRCPLLMVSITERKRERTQTQSFRFGYPLHGRRVIGVSHWQELDSQRKRGGQSRTAKQKVQEHIAEMTGPNLGQVTTATRRVLIT